MPDARLQRTREAYESEMRIGATFTLGPIRNTIRDMFPPPQPRCFCVDGLPDGLNVAQCPIHPMRTVRRGHVGQTN